MATGEGIFPIPRSVLDDTDAYCLKVERFLQGEFSPEAFRGHRVPMGIYEHRETGRFMVRVRLPGGIILGPQMRLIADLADRFGNGRPHITTRQDIQIHRVRIEDTPEVLRQLLTAGLSPRGGGGNTVRNVTACPLAGVCAAEVFDVSPYAVALTEYLISDPSSFNLPRKFKVALSGCSRDCALASVADVGLFAKRQDGQEGFAVYAGGGMGAQSSVAILIEEFIPAHAVFATVEAAKRHFDRHGDRKNRHRARLRYVLERLGPAAFRAAYREELERVREEGVRQPPLRPSPIVHASAPPSFQCGESALQSDTHPLPTHVQSGTLASSPLAGERAARGEDTSAEDGLASESYQRWRAFRTFPQRQPALYAVLVQPPLGDVPSDDLRHLADLADRHAWGGVRTTQEQGLYFTHVHEERLPDLYADLLRLSFAVTAPAGPRIMACAGASTCKLGLCLSRNLASAIDERLRPDRQIGEMLDGLTIRISGCPNACGQHPIGMIGLHGHVRRVHDRLVPHYVVLTGGHVEEGNARLAAPVACVPAKRIPAFLESLLREVARRVEHGDPIAEAIARLDNGQVAALAAPFLEIPDYEEEPDIYRDAGAADDFSLAGRGPGECGAGVLDVITLDLNQARQSLRDCAAATGTARSKHLYSALLAACRALLVTRGLEPRRDRKIFGLFVEHLITPGWVRKDARALVEAALDYRLGDRAGLDDLATRIEELVERVHALFASLDSSLRFRLNPVEDEPAAGTVDSGRATDLRGVACPLNFVRAKLELEQIAAGQTLTVLLDDGEPARNVPASFAAEGQEVLAVDPENGHFRVVIRKKT